MEVELEPQQPDVVEHAVVQALAEGDTRPDPWWQAGIEEALAT